MLFKQGVLDYVHQRANDVIIRPEDTFYAQVSPEDCEEIIQTHIIEGKMVERLLCQDIDGSKSARN